MMDNDIPNIIILGLMLANFYFIYFIKIMFEEVDKLKSEIKKLKKIM